MPNAPIPKYTFVRRTVQARLSPIATPAITGVGIVILFLNLPVNREITPPRDTAIRAAADEPEDKTYIRGTIKYGWGAKILFWLVVLSAPCFL